MHQNGLIDESQFDRQSEVFQFQTISADGSQRNFFRIVKNGRSLCVGVAPSVAEGQHLAEARAAMSIGRHLYSKGVPVPGIHAASKQTGVILFEDCGDIRLYDLLDEGGSRDGRLSEKGRELYGKVIRQLIHMQIEGADGFVKKWCYDTPLYDQEVMIKKESEYFLNAFWYNLLEGDQCPDIALEFEDIAVNAAEGPPLFFLHRDFQCRNIMVTGTDVKFIDFQGGRLGPLGYDLASLLIDPYSSLTENTREELLQLYLTELHNHLKYREDVFLRQYPYLAVQRNFQIIGAFAFLYKNRGKIFFKKYITPALVNLNSILKDDRFQHYTNLQAVVAQSLYRAKHYL